MGVTYKLTEDIVHFILEEKQKGPDLSCRELMGLVAQRLQKNVSKSSVHEVLRQAHVISRPGRKAKDTFQIPPEKKAQLLANLPDIGLLSPNPAKPVDIKPDKEAKDELSPLIKDSAQITLAEIFLKAAFTDLFPRPWDNVRQHSDLNSIDVNRLHQEWIYRNLPVSGFKIELENSQALYVDSRWRRLSEKPGQFSWALACPIERGLGELADFLGNPKQPLIIEQIETMELLLDLEAAMEGKKGKTITQVCALDASALPTASFSDVLKHKREFIAGIILQVIENKDVANYQPGDIKEAATYLSSQPLRFVKKNLAPMGWVGRALMIVGPCDEPQVLVVTNAPSSRRSDAEVVRMYAHRHPHQLSFPRQGESMEENFGLDPRLEHSGVTQSPAEDLLQQYAGKRFLGQEFTGEQWQKAQDMTGQVEYNDQVWRAAFQFPQTPGPQDLALMAAGQTLNTLYLKEEGGRSILIISH